MRAALFVLLAATASHAAPSFKDEVRASSFLKGNLHAHSDKSDGDAPASEVLKWYAAHGYDFAALTDHNKLTAAAAAGLVVISGDEITSRAGTASRFKPVHVGALCVDRAAAGVEKDVSRGEVLRDSLAAARAAGARFAVVNHPAWAKALDSADLLASSAWDAVEIASGHHDVQRDDAAAAESAEAMWDAALDRRQVYAVAGDDAHDFDGTIKKGENSLREPGKAWVRVWGAKKNEDSVCDALSAGRFYATTGPELAALEVSGAKFTVTAASWSAGDAVEFVAGGPKGRMTATRTANPAVYALTGGENWVRARLVQKTGKAWTQAFRVAP